MNFEKRAPAYRHFGSERPPVVFICFCQNKAQAVIQRIFPESFVSSGVRTDSENLTDVIVCMRTVVNTSFKESKLALAGFSEKGDSLVTFSADGYSLEALKVSGL